jgi:uncharacterized RDD family membrane protein YckC
MSMAAVQEDLHVTGRRVLAIIVDSIVLGIIFGVIGIIFAMVFGTTSASGGSVSASVNGRPALISFVLFFLYFILLEGYLGQTVGKMLLGIKVVREDTSDIPRLGAASVRNVLRIIDGLFAYLVGFIAILVSSKRQRLGDMAAHTLVVRKNRKKGVSGWPGSKASASFCLLVSGKA